MDSDLVQSDQQKKLAEQLIKKKYQAWKLLAIGFLLGFTIFTFSRFYYPTSGMSKPFPAVIDKNLNGFIKKFHHAFLLIYVLTWLTTLILITAGVFKYLKVWQEVEKLKENKEN